MISSADEFVSLRKSEKPEQYLRAANEDAAPEVWLNIIERFPDMRVWVVHNKTVPTEVLIVLARDPDPAVRLAVAMKNKLSTELFELLASDRDESVRQRLAYNKKTPIDILARLAEDRSELVSFPSQERLRALEQQNESGS
jgi:hypothetical protein